MLPDLATPALVLAGPGVDVGPLPEGVTYAVLGGPVPERKWATVLLAVADEAGLRRAVSVLPALGRARHVACHLAAATAPPTTVLRPEWPPLARLVAESADGGALTRLSFRRPAPAGPVLVELARHTGTPATTGNRGLVLSGTVAAPVDPTPVTEQVPAVVVVGGHGDLPEDPVLGRAPVAVDGGLGPLDEALLNPVGFRRDWDRGPVPLPDGEPTPALVASLRGAQAVVVGPGANPRTVAGLAMAGVPLVGAGFDVAPAELDDPLCREEHSVRLRRSALREHSSLGWRQRIGAAAGVRTAAYPSVSLLLDVRRPERLEHALRQVARQRGVDRLELVLATHGFDADAGAVRERLGDRPHALVTLPSGASPVEAAAGDVIVTMDGDDWYGPDVLADLLLARHYSGAELVAMPTEMGYVEGTDTTVRRRVASESFGGEVAGATLLVDRAVLRAVGRPGSVRAAGGRVYRTHGLGHLARVVDGDLWTTNVAGRWPGFRPCRLLESDG